MEEIQDNSIFDELNQESTYFEYASTGQRFLNSLIDVVVFYVIYFLVLFVLGAIMGILKMPGDTIVETFENKAFLYGVIFGVNIAYFTLMEGLTKGRTIGKYITKTVAVNEDCSPINFKTAFIRTLCRLIPFEWFGIFNGRPLHDSIAKTFVIKVRTAIY